MMWRQVLSVSQKLACLRCRPAQIYQTTNHSVIPCQARCLSDKSAINGADNNTDQKEHEQSEDADTFGTLSPELVKREKRKMEKRLTLQKLSATAYKEIQAMKSLKSALGKEQSSQHVSKSSVDDWKDTFGTLAEDEMKSLQLDMKTM